ncbi:MAG: ArgE/DapE family deacylase [Candidatus Bathyarchaeota archaeon]|nr:MAG: ArgE/DapE family deacylase [Candidatus Bathyarchaeota archaeon]
MTMNVKRRVLERIERDRGATINFLQKLISIPSVTGNEKNIQKFIAETLIQMGLEVDVWEPDIAELRGHPGYVSGPNNYENRPNVVGILKGQGHGKSLLLNGHVDVIPTGPLDAWNHDPWGGEIEAGKIYGRGASDMKSGLASMTMALNAIIKSGVNLAGNVYSEYTVDEELSGNGTLACILKGYRADAGISCETSSLKVQPASIGRIWFEIFIRGKSAGIQRRWEGVNAITKGYKLVQAVSELEDQRVAQLSHPLYPNPREALPCMVCMFQSGSYPSAFPDKCVLKGSLATLPTENSEEVKSSFIDHLTKSVQEDEWLGQHPPETKFTGYFAEPSEIPVDHPIVTTVAANLRETLTKAPTISGRLGAADTRFLNVYGRTPTVIFGPGPTEQMHAIDEWVTVNDLIVATKVVALTILDWCGYIE